MSAAEPAGVKRHSTSIIRCGREEVDCAFDSNKHIAVKKTSKMKFGNILDDTEANDNKTSKMKPGSILDDTEVGNFLDDTEVNEWTEHEEAANKEMDPNLTVYQRGADVVTGLVHESLTTIPRPSGFTIAVTILIGNAVFVALVSLYSYFRSCVLNAALIDSQWQLTESSGKEFNPYPSLYDAPTFLCASYALEPGDENSTEGYSDPCILTGLSCKDYGGNGRCPPVFSEYFNCTDDAAYDDDFYNYGDCGDASASASVAYMVCPTVLTSVSSAAALLPYFNLGLLVLLYGAYLLFFKKKARGETIAHLKDVLTTSFKK